MKEGKRWIRMVRCEEVPLREGRAIMVGDREIAIFNLGDRFLAVENRCPHRGGPLADGIVCGPTVVCPLHAQKFNLETGEAAGISASGCTPAFATRVENGIVLVELPIPLPRAEDGAEVLTESPNLLAVATPAASSEFL